MNGQQVVKWFAGTATVKPNDVQWISGAEFKRAFPSEARGFNYDLLKLTPIVDNRTYAIGAVGSSVRPITRRVIFVDTDKPTKCGAMCRNAKGPMCDCSCKGENHGASAAMARSRFTIADIDLQPTQEMADNAERGLKLRQQHGRGGTAVGVARKTAQIDKNESAYGAARKSTMARNKYLPADEIVHSFNDGWTVVKRWDGYLGKYGLLLTNKGKQNIHVDSLNEAKQRHDSINHWIFRATIVENKPNEFLIQATKVDGGWALGDRGGKPFKTKDAAQKSLEKQQADQRRKLGMSRHGKATMAKREYVLWALPKGETDRMHEKPIAYNITKPADMERIKVEATKRGYHSFRVQVIEWARSGAKAAFDAFNPFTAPAKPASWDGKRITLNNKMYKVEPNGGAYDLYDMNTNKKAKTVTAEQLYRAWSQGRITSIYSCFGAKARFADQDLAQELVRVRIGNETVSAREFMNYAKQFVPNVSRNDSLADIVEKVNAALAQRGDKVRTQIVTTRPTYKIPLRIVTRSKMSRFGGKETHMKNGMKAAFSATPHKVTYTDKSGVTHTYMVSDKILRAMNGTKRYAESVGSKPDYSSVLRLGERTGEVVRASRSGAKAQFDLRAKVAQMKTMVSKLVTTLGFKPDEVTGNEQMMHILFLNKPKQADRLAAALRTNLARVGVPNSAITTHENYYADENTTYGGVWIDLTALANAAGKMSRARFARWEEHHSDGWGDVSVSYTLNGTNWEIVMNAATGKGYLMRKTASGHKVVKEGSLEQLKRYAETTKSSRSGAKAAFAITKEQIRGASKEELRSIEQRLMALAKSGDKNAAALLDYVEEEYNDRYRGTHSRAGAKAAFAEELIQKLSGGWEIVKIDGILHLAKGNEAIPVPNVQRAMELHRASTEGRLMKENVAGTKTQAFSRVGEEEAFDIGASSDVEDPTKDEQLIALANRVGREHTVNLFKCWSEGKASMGYAQ